jgi:hypothetical protein
MTVPKKTGCLLARGVSSNVTHAAGMRSACYKVKAAAMYLSMKLCVLSTSAACIEV